MKPTLQIPRELMSERLFALAICVAFLGSCGTSQNWDPPKNAGGAESGGSGGAAQSGTSGATAGFAGGVQGGSGGGDVGDGGVGGGSLGGSGAGGSGAGGNTGSLSHPVIMSDVSLLFPVGTPAELSSGHLQADATGSRGALFPKAVYQRIPIAGSKAAGIGTDGIAPYENLSVVAMRLDPCFADLKPTAASKTCKNQLRLVFQELTVNGAAVEAFDSGVHAFYSLSREELLSVAAEIVQLREATAGSTARGALAPHPIMAAQGLGGAFSKGVQAIILRYAGESNLVRATAMTSANAGFNWEFSGFELPSGAQGTPTPIEIADLPTGTVKEIFFRGFSPSAVEGSFTPGPTGPDDFTALAKEASAPTLSATEKAKIATALVHFTNPAFTTPDSVDCAQCHTADPLEDNIGVKAGISTATEPDSFKRDERWVLATEMVASDFSFGQMNGPAVIVHAFSYARGVPTVSRRTVNETAAVVAFLNNNFLSSP